MPHIVLYFPPSCTETTKTKKTWSGEIEKSSDCCCYCHSQYWKCTSSFHQPLFSEGGPTKIKDLVLHSKTEKIYLSADETLPTHTMNLFTAMSGAVWCNNSLLCYREEEPSSKTNSTDCLVKIYLPKANVLNFHQVSHPIKFQFPLNAACTAELLIHLCLCLNTSEKKWLIGTQDPSSLSYMWASAAVIPPHFTFLAFSYTDK